MKALTTFICLASFLLQSYSQTYNSNSDETIILFVTGKGELHHIKIIYKSEEYVITGKGKIISISDTNGLNIIKANNDIQIIVNKVNYIREARLHYQFDGLDYFSTFSFKHPLKISYRFGQIEHITCDTSKIIFTERGFDIGDIPNVRVYHDDKYFDNYDYIPGQTDTSCEKIIFQLTPKGELHYLQIRYYSEEFLLTGKGKITGVMDTNGLNIVKAIKDINILGNKVTNIRQAVFDYQIDNITYFSTFSFPRPVYINYRLGLINEISCDTSRIIFNWDKYTSYSSKIPGIYIR